MGGRCLVRAIDRSYELTHFDTFWTTNLVCSDGLAQLIN